MYESSLNYRNHQRIKLQEIFPFEYMRFYQSRDSKFDSPLFVYMVINCISVEKETYFFQKSL